MAAFFIGIFTLLFGALIVANAAFSDRAQFGSVVFLIGAALAVGGIVELIF